MVELWGRYGFSSGFCDTIDVGAGEGVLTKEILKLKNVDRVIAFENQPRLLKRQALEVGLTVTTARPSPQHSAYLQDMAKKDAKLTFYPWDPWIIDSWQRLQNNLGRGRCIAVKGGSILNLATQI